jgi:hypothetical protein
LVLTDGTNAEAVEKWRAAHTEALATLYGDAGALPVVQSEGIAGLNPGFFVLVPSVCPVEDADEAFAAALHTFPGAHSRTVQVPAGFGDCRRARQTEWWTLSLRSEDVLCDLVRAPLGPQPEPESDDPNVIPPPPEGTEHLQHLDGPCPEWWSAVLSDSGEQLVLNAHASQTLGLATHAHRVVLGGAEGQAEVIDPKGDLESVTFVGEVPEVHLLDHELEEPAPSDTATIEAVYTGSLEALFLRWGLEDRAVTGLPDGDVRKAVPADAVQVFACVDARKVGRTWVEQARRIVATTEGSLAPHCTAGRPANNHGFSDDLLRGARVPQALADTFTAAAGAPAGTAWTFVGMSGVGLGDLAVSTHTEIGSTLTGFVVGHDGKTVHRMAGLKGTLTNLHDLDHGRVLLCTDKGHGAFQSRTGARLWWSPERQCPVVFRE